MEEPGTLNEWWKVRVWRKGAKRIGTEQELVPLVPLVPVDEAKKLLAELNPRSVLKLPTAVTGPVSTRFGRRSSLTFDVWTEKKILPSVVKQNGLYNTKRV
jgi:uncharacterized membrane protein YdbT with pleckstrin-like domain